MSRRKTSVIDPLPSESEPERDPDDPLAFLKGVGRALVEERRRCGLSQQQVAERIGIEPETVSRIETGVIAPTLIRLRQFAKVYGCSLQGLLGRTSDTLPDLAQRIAVELNPLPPTDQRHVAEQAVATARYLQALRRDGS
jgi:transcriptional regulator with XRE-family HTH domain